MAVNQVKFGNQIVIDITDSTVNANTLLAGYKAYGANGEQVTGNVELSYHITLRQDQYDELTEQEKMADENFFYIHNVDVVAADIDDTTKSTGKVWSSSKVGNELDGLQDEIIAICNVYGSKNLFNMYGEIRGSGAPYMSGTPQSIKIKNTTAGTYRNTAIYVDVPKNTDLIISSDVDYISGVGLFNVYTADGVTQIMNSGLITSDTSASFTFNTGNNDRVLVSLFCTHATSEMGEVNYNNFMIKDARIKDGTFVPYVPTNKDLAYVLPTIKNNGVYNIAPRTLGNVTSQGVTYTINPENNIVTATWSSTPTGNAVVAHCNNILTDYLTAGKTYKLTGCPTGGSWFPNPRKYRLYVYDETTSTDASVDFGNGAIFTPQSGHKYSIWIVIGADAGASGSLTFKPMITTDLNATYNDYVPYAIINRQLTLKTLYNSNNIYVYRQGNIIVAHFNGVTPKNIADLNFANIGAKPKTIVSTFQCRCDSKPTTVEINANGVVANVGYYASYGSSYTDLKTDTTKNVYGTISYVAD